VHILRVHEVGPARETAAIADRVLEAADASLGGGSRLVRGVDDFQ